jgi:hypothetical protein
MSNLIAFLSRLPSGDLGELESYIHREWQHAIDEHGMSDRHAALMAVIALDVAAVLRDRDVREASN